MGSLQIRAAEFEDHPRLVEIQNQGAPPLSMEEFRAREERRPLGPMKMRFVGEADGEIVATGSIRRWESFADGMMLIGVYVDEPFQNRGLGRQMFEHCEHWAKDAGTNLLVGFVRDSHERGIKFMEAAGYSFLQHLFESEVPMANFDPSVYDPLFQRLNHEGIEIVTFDNLDDTPELRSQVHQVYITADRDTPGIEMWGVADHSTFEQEFFGAEWFRKEGLALALHGGDIVGVSALGPMSSGIWSTDFTGVLRGFRGRGIAIALKVKALEYAKRAGATAVSTNNDANNQAMLAVNRKLGFVSQPGWIYLKKAL